jgi:hypothetical protein
MKSAIFMRRGGIDVDFVFSREALQARFVKYFTSRSRRPAIRFYSVWQGRHFFAFSSIEARGKTFFCDKKKCLAFTRQTFTRSRGLRSFAQ